MSKKKLCVPANKEAIDINVVRPEDFETAADYDEYLSANWPGVIIHNLFIQSEILKRLEQQLIEINKGIKQLDSYFYELFKYEFRDGLEEKKIYGH